MPIVWLSGVNPCLDVQVFGIPASLPACKTIPQRWARGVAVTKPTLTHPLKRARTWLR